METVHRHRVIISSFSFSNSKVYGIKFLPSGLFDHHVELSYFFDICELFTILCLAIGFPRYLSVSPFCFCLPRIQEQNVLSQPRFSIYSI